jgi:hypothetical protein
MYGDEAVRFLVPEGSNAAEFIGSSPGRNAMLRRDERTTVSAVAIFRHAAGSGIEIDLYHNPFAAIPIDPALPFNFVFVPRSWFNQSKPPCRSASMTGMA